jgi:hypothetical protein
MELINSSRMPAVYTLGGEPSGRDSLVVVIKGTFAIPEHEGRAVLAEVQQPVVAADTFSGEPGMSAPIRETDLAPAKRRCEILVIGSAHAPGGRPAKRVAVGIRVGGWQKTVAVHGDRHWQSSTAGVRASAAEPFVVMPITYDFAYGGVDRSCEEPDRHVWYARNPVGRGFFASAGSAGVDGSPLPNCEAVDVPVAVPDGGYEPVSLGPVGRNWVQRSRYAGTYDAAWLEEQFPFLPQDFDERYYQSAPEDQQLDTPVQEVAVVMANLTSQGRQSFRLPVFQAPVHVFPKRGGTEVYSAALDTIVFEPDAGCYTMTWRLARPLKRDLFEVAQVVVGRKDATWWRERERTRFPIPLVAVPYDNAASLSPT